MNTIQLWVPDGKSSKPRLIVLSDTTETDFRWMSDGWGDDDVLMDRARNCIRKGKDPQEVTVLLKEAGFDVVFEADYFLDA